MKTWDWQFYVDGSGQHRWQRLSEDGSVRSQSTAAFATCDACIEDASRHGYSLFSAGESTKVKTGS